MTERTCDPAKVDDATLCEIAALATEHGVRVKKERSSSELQKDCKNPSLTERGNGLNQLGTLRRAHCSPPFDPILIQEEGGWGGSDIELSNHLQM